MSLYEVRRDVWTVLSVGVDAPRGDQTLTIEASDGKATIGFSWWSPEVSSAELILRYGHDQTEPLIVGRPPPRSRLTCRSPPTAPAAC